MTILRFLISYKCNLGLRRPVEAEARGRVLLRSGVRGEIPCGGELTGRRVRPKRATGEFCPGASVPLSRKRQRTGHSLLSESSAKFSSAGIKLAA